MAVFAVTLDWVLKTLKDVGIDIDEVDQDDHKGDLYAWVTPKREVLYIGKSKANGISKRTREENRWRHATATGKIDSAIIALLQNNHAVQQRLRFVAIDADALVDALAGWTGPGIDRLRIAALAPWTAEDIEKVLIRTAVRTGAPIGNSQFAGQWENLIGKPYDTVAAVAVERRQGFCCAPTPISSSKPLSP